jgi:CDP-diacylglycerol---glycerol-3-phosphate 3-phosphatidyltransferase
LGIANQLTLVRLCLCPVLVLVIYLGGATGHGWTASIGYGLAFVLTAIIEITDILDGRLARSRHETSDFGKLVDPLSDVLAHLSLFLCFQWLGYAHFLLVLAVIYREVLIAYLRTASARAGVVLASRSTGKVKTVVYATASLAILLLINLTLYIGDILTPEIAKLISQWLMGIVAGISVYSGVEYILGNWPIVRSLLHPGGGHD